MTQTIEYRELVRRHERALAERDRLRATNQSLVEGAKRDSAQLARLREIEGLARLLVEVLQAEMPGSPYAVDEALAHLSDALKGTKLELDDPGPIGTVPA